MQRKQVVRFTAAQAHERMGNRVRSLIEFAGVPKGTSGVVVDVYEFDTNQFDVVIAWDLPSRQNPRDRFAKDPYEEFLLEEAPDLALAV